MKSRVEPMFVKSGTEHKWQDKFIELFEKFFS